MENIPDRHHSLEEAIYLGVLTAQHVKPLSRLEYSVEPKVFEVFKRLRLATAPITRYAQSGAVVTHLVLSSKWSLIRQYQIAFAGTVIRGEIPVVVREEAKHFGYPACCAEAYLREPYAPNGLTEEDKALLFHYACPGCKVTPRLIPLYESALAATRQILNRIA
jgi:hypothetical protein